MGFDFKAMQEQMAKELAADSRSESTYDSEYPLVYTANNGKLTVKLLLNKKMGGLQRRILRHPGDAEGKSKVPCLSQFSRGGEPLVCPICEAIRNAEQAKGKEIGAFRKYGYKIRGICYAQIIDHDATYFTEESSPRKKDIVMLMYPKTVYDQLNKLMVDAGANIEKVLGTNSGIPVIIERSQRGKEFPKFNVSFDAFHEVSSFGTDAEFEALLDKLPNLNDAFYPVEITDEIETKVNQAAQAITQEYLGGNIVNPTKKEAEPKPEPKKVEVAKSEDSTVAPFEPDDEDELPFEVDVPKSASEGATEKVEANGMPECFGKHDDNSNKCNLCVHECDCVLSSEL